MSDKKKVIAKLREVVHGGNFPSRLQLLNWVNTLEQSEQQGPPSAVGQPSSGESSVQPVAQYANLEAAIAKKIQALELYADEAAIHARDYLLAHNWTQQSRGLHLALAIIKRIESEKTQIEHEAKCRAAG